MPPNRPYQTRFTGVVVPKELVVKEYSDPLVRSSSRDNPEVDFDELFNVVKKDIDTKQVPIRAHHAVKDPETGKELTPFGRIMDSYMKDGAFCADVEIDNNGSLANEILLKTMHDDSIPMNERFLQFSLSHSFDENNRMTKVNELSLVHEGLRTGSHILNPPSISQNEINSTSYIGNGEQTLAASKSRTYIFNASKKFMSGIEPLSEMNASATDNATTSTTPPPAAAASSSSSSSSPPPTTSLPRKIPIVESTCGEYFAVTYNPDGSEKKRKYVDPRKEQQQKKNATPPEGDQDKEELQILSKFEQQQAELAALKAENSKLTQERIDAKKLLLDGEINAMHARLSSMKPHSADQEREFNACLKVIDENEKKLMAGVNDVKSVEELESLHARSHRTSIMECSKYFADYNTMQAGRAIFYEGKGQSMGEQLNSYYRPSPYEPFDPRSRQQRIQQANDVYDMSQGKPRQQTERNLAHFAHPSQYQDEEGGDDDDDEDGDGDESMGSENDDNDDDGPGYRKQQQQQSGANKRKANPTLKSALKPKSSTLEKLNKILDAKTSSSSSSSSSGAQSTGNTNTSSLKTRFSVDDSPPARFERRTLKAKRHAYVEQAPNAGDYDSDDEKDELRERREGSIKAGIMNAGLHAGFHKGAKKEVLQAAKLYTYQPQDEADWNKMNASRRGPLNLGVGDRKLVNPLLNHMNIMRHNFNDSEGEVKQLEPRRKALRDQGKTNVNLLSRNNQESRYRFGY
jgi:hypothetical protein